MKEPSNDTLKEKNPKIEANSLMNYLYIVKPGIMWTFEKINLPLNGTPAGLKSSTASNGSLSHFSGSPSTGISIFRLSPSTWKRMIND